MVSRQLGSHCGRYLTDHTCRLNTKLEAKDLEPMTDLVKDFSSGVKLIEVSDMILRDRNPC